MNPLLNRVVDASGGLDLWSRTSTITADVSVGGPIWAVKGWSDAALRDLTVTVDIGRQHTVITPFTTPHRSVAFDNTRNTALDGVSATGAPERVVLRDTAGEIVQERTDPRAAFAGVPRSAPWDALQLGYFLGYALWNYFTAPALLLRPDVRTREIEPWREAGRTWRRLRVRFPATLATHSLEQTFYYDADGLQRRMDYVNGVCQREDDRLGDVVRCADTARGVLLRQTREISASVRAGLGGVQITVDPVRNDMLPRFQLQALSVQQDF
ncbi:hypothetical protein KQY30_29120 [Streptomyces sp. GMY02]|uniref:hypothetical protein n=1 Tax=Streptomyces sp. GMY02 TaxID=1333528 RepID=UPI001C2BAE49|nr:hypothetical protein [Streptomyces sp. GMY02]QXE37685.1 hypothetical protein KQY30_29120 [Streptomyces sp. GMY02]